MRYFYSLLAVVVLAVALTAPIQAAFTKISDLPAITSPSTNTWIEVADMAAATKSRKYLLTNLATVAQVPTLPTNMVVSTGASLAGQAAVYTDANGTNTAPSLLTITNGAINAGNVFADVRVYGAIMDGSDDTAALQAAVNSGRVVLVPAGTLTYTGTIAMKSGAGIVGQGIGITTLRKTGHGIGIKVDGTNNTTRLVNTILSGFTLQGDNSAFAGDYGIVYHHANFQHRIENVEVRYCGDVGLLFKGDCFEIRGQNVQLMANLGADQIAFQATPDPGGEAANDITLSDVYTLPAASTRALHFSNTSGGNIIQNLIIQSPAPEVEAISFDGNLVKNNWIRGVVAYDQAATNGATAFVVFNNASENVVDGFNGGMDGIPVFDFKTNSVRNVIINGTESGSVTYAARTDSGSTDNTFINWQGNNSAILDPASTAPVGYAWGATLDWPTLKANGVNVGLSLTGLTNRFTNTVTKTGDIMSGILTNSTSFRVVDNLADEIDLSGWNGGLLLKNDHGSGYVGFMNNNGSLMPNTFKVGWTPGTSFAAADTTIERVSAGVIGTAAVNIGTLAVTNSIDSIGAIIGRKAFQSYQGSLTHAGTVTINFDAATTVNSLSLTGDVTFAFSNLATNRTYALRVLNAQATNCAVTFPAGAQTNFFGGKPTTLTAGKRALWTMTAWGTTDADVDNAWAETQ